MAMDWLKTDFYPWACAVAEDTANSVTTNAVSLSRAAFRSSSAGLSGAIQFVRGLSGSAAMRATEMATATMTSLNDGAATVLRAVADDFWSSFGGGW